MTEASDRLQRVFEDATFGILLFTPCEGGSLVLAALNPAAERLLGVDGGSVLGRTVEELPSLTGTDLPARLRAIAREGGHHAFEPFRPEGDPASGAYAVHAFQLGAGEAAVALAPIPGPSDEADEFEAIGRIAGGVAHRLNNELTGILSAVDALRGDLAGRPELEATLESIRDSALRSARLTSQLLGSPRGDVRRAADLDPATERPATAPSPSRSLRVLVADDEANVRRTLTLLLRGSGHSVVECSGGREAVERFEQEAAGIDVVVLDMMMPDLPGREVFSLLRKKSPRVPVIVSSGLAAGETDALLAEEGVHLLQKPYTVEQLARTLSAATGRPVDP